MPTYKLKPIADVYNYVPGVLQRTLGDNISSFVDMHRELMYDIYEQSGDFLFAARDYLMEIFEATEDEANQQIWNWFWDGRNTDKLSKVPNFAFAYLSRGIRGDGVNSFPIIWSLKTLDGSGIDMLTELDNMCIQGYLGASYGDENFGISTITLKDAVNAQGYDLSTYGELLSETDSDDRLYILAEIFGNDFDLDVFPRQVPACNKEVFFTQNNDTLYFTGVVIFFGTQTPDEYVAIRFSNEGDRPGDGHGFNGLITFYGKETGTISQSRAGKGYWADACSDDISADLDTEAGLPLSELYALYPELRPYIKIIPDPEPEKVGLQRTKCNNIRVF